MPSFDSRTSFSACAVPFGLIHRGPYVATDEVRVGVSAQAVAAYWQRRDNEGWLFEDAEHFCSSRSTKTLTGGLMMEPSLITHTAPGITGKRPDLIVPPLSLNHSAFVSTILSLADLKPMHLIAIYCIPRQMIITVPFSISTSTSNQYLNPHCAARKLDRPSPF